MKRIYYMRTFIKPLIWLTFLFCLNAQNGEESTHSKQPIQGNSPQRTQQATPKDGTVLVEKNTRFLRADAIRSASEYEIQVACEMYEQGWRYTMPRPKSEKAAWGVTDGRTTWFEGSWHNDITGQYSSTTPQKTPNGLYSGNNQNNSNSWRRGGSPARPDIYMFLLSQFGGPHL